jgi:hypothetical protein
MDEELATLLEDFAELDETGVATGDHFASWQ